MDFKIDYGSMPLTPRPTPPAGPMYASIEGRVSSLSNGEVVFLDASTDQLHVMTEQVLGAMDVCRPFRTLDEHVTALRQAIPSLPQQGDAVRRVLDNLVSRGLLVSDADYLAQLQQRTQGSAPAAFAGFFIRACDRPAQLKRLLASLLEYERSYAPAHPYTLLDDSRDAANARENRRLLDEFATEARVGARYLGNDSWARISDMLAKESGQQKASDWLLRRMPETREHGGGLAMNLIALLAAGRRYALLDDDFVFPLRLHPQFDPRTDLGPGDPVPARFFPDIDAALAAGQDPGRDPLQLHLDACGLRLGELVGSHPHLQLGVADLRGAAPSRLTHLQSGRRVVATVNGHRGHSGSASSGWLFLLDPASRESLWADRDQYLRQLDSPNLWFGPNRATLRAHGNFTPFMVDAARMLPCTRPSGRAEDQLFAGLCRLIDPNTLSLDLPLAVGHRQERERNRGESLRSAFAPGFNAYVADLAMGSAGEFHAADPALRLRGFAGRLRDLAAASEASILGELREHLAYARSTLVGQLHAVMHSAKGAPVYWMADLRQLIETNGKALVQSSVPRLGDWDAGLDAAGCAATFRQQMDEQALALDAWPALWQLALEQRERVAACIAK